MYFFKQRWFAALVSFAVLAFVGCVTTGVWVLTALSELWRPNPFSDNHAYPVLAVMVTTFPTFLAWAFTRKAFGPLRVAAIVVTLLVSAQVGLRVGMADPEPLHRMDSQLSHQVTF